ncbi:major facilitator superfamily domain-containing protein [Xylariaceae sp. FL1272]|nr:major facilitator superfamily domain-containing protein [Xylariaceae sp. FL1272]
MSSTTSQTELQTLTPPRNGAPLQLPSTTKHGALRRITNNDIPTLVFQHILLWPAAVYALALSTTLLLLGAIADLFVAEYVPINRVQDTAGYIHEFLLTDGGKYDNRDVPQRATAEHRVRDFGGGSLVGFATGLVLGGALVQASSWRTACYLVTALCAATFAFGWFAMPESRLVPNVRHRLLHEFDWVGRHERPAILPKSIWRSKEFSTICITVFLVWSWFNAFGYWSTLFFQETRGLSPLQTALRFLPLIVIGFATNVVAGLIMDKVSASTLVLVGGLISAAGPLLFALMDPDWIYWAQLMGYRSAFWTCFAAAVASMVVSSVGLRNIGMVGVKKNV